ncbi:hypothetical protein [Streptomyces fuscichromogenes]|uniref:Lipoprotein n=1 Tax=Streptomyces fuscichromogenes TaxID=1324013 RepID=A0A917XK98_9ACTN|nr:hypothetical protein [Streptomyces fuscichromogenes]GGN34045.1 hypothetical protein GCM10011578_074470 [Streptomyces fuscichromogenes]
MAKLTKAHAALTIALAAGIPLSSGCTAQKSQDSPKKASSVSATPSDRDPVVDVTKTPPDISGSAKALVRLANRTGPQEVAVIENIKAGTVAVATECNGEGKTTIVIGKLATYTVPCAATPATTYNEIGLGSSKKDVKITITASAGVHWGLSVGWRPEYQPPRS